jgi:hypothetical protein
MYLGFKLQSLSLPFSEHYAFFKAELVLPSSLNLLKPTGYVT